MVYMADNNGEVVQVTDTNEKVWDMHLNAQDRDLLVPGLRLFCTDAPINKSIPEIWECEKAALMSLGYVIFELTPDYAWVFEPRTE
jgi:hypothetical protein